jgi:hypothetical protein
VNGIVTVIPTGNVDTGHVSDLRDFPGGGVLIFAEKGLFLAREVNGIIFVTTAGNVDTGVVTNLHDFPGGGVLIFAEKGLFLAIPRSPVAVTLRNKKQLDGSSTYRDVTIEFLMAHGCAFAADKLGVSVRVTAPGEKPSEQYRIFVAPDPKIAEITMPNLWVDKAGQWMFQLIAPTPDGMVGLVGDPQTLTFVSGPWWERWWKTLTSIFAMALVVANIAIFEFARRPPKHGG